MSAPTGPAYDPLSAKASRPIPLVPPPSDADPAPPVVVINLVVDAALAERFLAVAERMVAERAPF